eukprot:8170547-Pyramimonas_sp.AAC.1
MGRAPHAQVKVPLASGRRLTKDEFAVTVHKVRPLYSSSGAPCVVSEPLTVRGDPVVIINGFAGHDHNVVLASLAKYSNTKMSYAVRDFVSPSGVDYTALLDLALAAQHNRQTITFPQDAAGETDLGQQIKH